MPAKCASILDRTRMARVAPACPLGRHFSILVQRKIAPSAQFSIENYTIGISDIKLIFSAYNVDVKLFQKTLPKSVPKRGPGIQFILWVLSDFH